MRTTTSQEGVRRHLKRHDENLHTMYKAINVISQMAGKHKEKIDELQERITFLEGKKK